MWATAPVMITVCVVFSGAVELMRQNREALEISNEDSEQKSDMKVAKTELAPQAEISQKSQAHQALTLAKQCLETADTEMIKAEAMAADVAARELEIDQKLKEAKARLALATEKANVTEKAVTQKAQTHAACPAGYVYTEFNLDDEGKTWHSNPSRNAAGCAGFCDQIAGCTSFEFNKAGDEGYKCGTYTGGASNIQSGRQSAKWLSCTKQATATTEPAGSTEATATTEPAGSTEASCGKYKNWGCQAGGAGASERCCGGLFCDTTIKYQGWHGWGLCKDCYGEDQSCSGGRECCTGYFCDPTVGSGTCKAWGMGKYSKAHCMSMKLCYDELPENMTSDKTWECACVWGQKQNDPMCKPWHDCIETKKAQEGETFKWLLKAVVGLEEGKHAFAQNTSQNMAAVQESADQACEDNEAIIAGWKKNTCALQAAIPGRCNAARFKAKGACDKTCGWCQATAPASTETTEPAGSTEATEAGSQLHCQNPTTMDIMAVECECGASKRKECEGSANPQECWERVICNHPGVCDSWKLKWCPSATIEQLLDQGPVDDAASLDEAMTGKRSC